MTDEEINDLLKRWPNFTLEELTCSCCNAFNPHTEFIFMMDNVQILRTELKYPFPVTAAYRCPLHPIEAKKEKPGQHYYAAVDINVWGYEAYRLVQRAMNMGVFGGIGINQKGPLKERFIHLDSRITKTIWSY